jgi:tagaturonate reductase
LELPKNELMDFAEAVGERFANPFIKHYLLSISLNSTSKFKTRVLPSITKYAEREGKLPQVLTFSLSALIAFYHGTEINGNVLKGIRKTGEGEVNSYDIADDLNVLELFRELWKGFESGSIKLNELALKVLSRTEMWGMDLNTIPGFTSAVAEYLQKIVADGMAASLKELVQGI